MKRLIPAIVIGMVMGTGTSATANEPEKFTGTFLVGDSIMAGASSRLLAVRPNWEIDAVPGRLVSELPGILQALVDRGGVLPDTVVIGLGTNAVQGWGKRQYLDAISVLPADTRIVFITTWRDPTLWPKTLPYYQQADAQYTISKAMLDIVNSRPNTENVPWRSTVRYSPELLHDGTHPTAHGKDIWVEMVTDAVFDIRHE